MGSGFVASDDPGYNLVDGYDGLFVQMTEVQLGCLKRRIGGFKRKFKLSTFGAAAAKATRARMTIRVFVLKTDLLGP
jgi:hypothetical protein